MGAESRSDQALRPSPGPSRHPLPKGEGITSTVPLPLGEGAAKRRVRVAGLDNSAVASNYGMIRDYKPHVGPGNNLPAAADCRMANSDESSPSRTHSGSVHHPRRPNSV